VEIDFHDGRDAAAPTGRRYTLLVNESQKAVFKIGTKNPVVSGSFQPATAGATANTQYTHIDVGVNIECVVRESGGKIALHGLLDVSDIAPHDSSAASARNPTIRQTKLELDTTIELGKATVVASIDDPATARKLRVEATVTKAD
jgi:type II secretory pathway component GspD/PulD (secretin)